MAAAAYPDPLRPTPAAAALRGTTGLPRLPAVALADGRGGTRLAVWCEWCERPHEHGATPGSRCRHCDPESGEPFGGYVLDPVRPGRRAAEAAPRRLLAGRLFRQAVALASEALQTALAVGCLQGTGATLTVGTDRGAWRIVGPTGLRRNGLGLLALVEACYGVGIGVAGVRVLEAALGLALDAKAARDIVTALEAWNGRGRPGPHDGPAPTRS